MGSYIKAIITIIVLLFFVTFGVKNNQTIQLNYYFDILNITLPLYGLAYISILIGIVIGMVIGLNSRFRLRRKAKNLERDIQDLKEKMSYGKEMEKEESQESL